jgi:hypothetical protein
MPELSLELGAKNIDFGADTFYDQRVFLVEARQDLNGQKSVARSFRCLLESQIQTVLVCAQSAHLLVRAMFPKGCIGLRGSEPYHEEKSNLE